MSDEPPFEDLEAQLAGRAPQLTSRQIEEKDQIAADQARIRQLYLRQRMSEPLFREWLMSWLTRWGTFTMTLAATPNYTPDRDGTMFKLGERSAGWDLWCEVDSLAPELASLMRREATGQA